MIRPEFERIVAKLAAQDPSTRRAVADVLSALAQATPAHAVGTGELEEIARTVRAPVVRRGHVVGAVDQPQTSAPDVKRSLVR